MSALPEPVRARVVALADDALASLAPGDAPAALRPFLRFAPAKRARHAAPALAAALEVDEGFRDVVVERLRLALPDLVAALEGGRDPAAAEPADVGAAAYLLRAPGWEQRVGAMVAEERGSAREAEVRGLRAALERSQEQLAVARAQGRAETERVRGELAVAKAEVVDLRRKLHLAREELRGARGPAREPQEVPVREAAAPVEPGARAEGELERARGELAALRAELERVRAGHEAARRSAREGRAADDTRLRLLLDVLGDAAAGLRRELALGGEDLRPGDLVAARPAATGVGDVPARALAEDDPAVLDALLALPRVHLVVDGYNVTKLGYPSLPLQGQRERLVGGLAGVAARTGAEVTCCFDGAALDAPAPAPRQRGVRVLFSRPGESADELIRRLAAAEPAGRPVVVVSDDREVADGVRRSGARPVRSAALLKRLERA
ncbi:putative RNA-binding protein with PIN domain [Motilibacter rhizosphaerae]|uniref:Putative RNA-binding protein with PIN domain n=1 Tax=Motilibacter rhizosphaerae TaxID=598652 RepID=A0A4Q7NR79_9ACTN|nr:NYN domain-containing protein [Motilibacter rhizosphaerae]RZS89541.1 putative RNA-binding protein with PIN domain [Motilibacter rhizosphaerae]